MPKTAEEIQLEIQRRREGEGVAAPVHQAAAPSAKRRGYKWIHPFSSAADGLIEYAQNPEGRFMLGMHDIDVMTRGFGRKELVYVTGRAHSGKTQVVLQGVANNPDRRIIIFTPDETSELILSKLVAMTHGIDSEALEERIKSGDQDAIDIVRKTATHDYRNLIVIDDSLTLGQMHEAVREAEDFWGAQVDCVVIDFLELIIGEESDGDGVVAKSQAVKRFGTDLDTTVICLHQAKRATRGVAGGMDAMRYGGETEATFVLEVFRKRENPELDEWEKLAEADTVTVNVAKNKRPPCKKGEVDLHMDPQTGKVRCLPPTIKREDVGGLHTGQQPVALEQSYAEREAARFMDREMF